MPASPQLPYTQEDGEQTPTMPEELMFLEERDRFIVERKMRQETWIQMEKDYEIKWGKRTGNALKMRFHRLKRKHSTVRRMFGETG